MSFRNVTSCEENVTDCAVIATHFCKIATDLSGIATYFGENATRYEGCHIISVNFREIWGDLVRLGVIFEIYA